MTQTHTFIKAAELWHPSPDGWMLELDSAAFGPAKSFAHLSRSMCFGRGEGLPGRAWDEAHPILLRQFENSYFRRAVAARAAGLHCAVALPFFRGDKIIAVLVIFCGHAPELAGALELWQADSAPGADMTLVDAAYEPAAPGFESASKKISFPPGVGLPGLAWEQGTAQFLEDLGDPAGPFMRGVPASVAGLVRGLALPLGSHRGKSYVVTVLAGAKLPLARRIERWSAGDARDTLKCTYAFSETRGGPSGAGATLAIPDGEPGTVGALASAWLNGMPAINETLAGEPEPVAAAAAAAGATGLLAIPQMRAGAVAEVLALYL